MSADAVAKRLKLGDKIPVSSAPDASQLGATYALQDVHRVARDFVNVTGASVEVKLVRNGGASPINPGARLRSVAAPVSVDVAGATDVVVGYVDPWLSTPVAVGEVFLMIVEGPTRVRSGGAFAAGAVLGGDSAGRSVTGGTAGLTGPARAIGAATGADQLVRAYVNCRAAI